MAIFEEKMEVNERVYGVIRKVLDIPDLLLKPETTAHSVDGWDSIAHIQILLGIEREFKIKLMVAKAMEAKKLSDLVQLVLEKYKNN